MSEMVERVAIAIEDECAGCDPRDKDAFLKAARAAIQAMRKPTETMTEAMLREEGRQYSGDEMTSPSEVLDVVKVWRVGLDEAL